jgi:hypothetical protein
MERKKILEKLRKLLNLKESAIVCGNEGEAQAAAYKITELLLLYNLEEKDIPSEEKIDNPIVIEEIPYKSEYCSGTWYSSLIAVVCNYNMCKAIIVQIPNSNGRLHREKFQLIGRAENLKVVRYLVSFLANKFYYVGKNNYFCLMNAYKEQGITRAKYLKSFLSGCIVGLKYRYQSLENANVTALIKSNEDDISEFLKGVHIKKAAKSKETIDSRGYNEGIGYGKTVKINRGIENNIKLIK